MVRKLFKLVLLLFVVSCSKDPIPINDTPDIPIVTDNKSEYFEFNHPYQSINLTSGTIAESFVVPKKTMDSEYMYNTTFEYDAVSNIRYQVRRNSYKFFDFNQDGKTDVFFYRNRFSQSYLGGRGPGQLGVIDDIYGDKIITIIETDRTYNGWIEPNDFDGDGVLEFIVYGNEDHDYHTINGQQTKKPLSYVNITIDGQIQMKRIGPITSSHDITSGDFDNDGDIDIINFEWWMRKTEDEKQFKQQPIFYINDGSGNFTTTTDNMIFEERFSQDERHFTRMSSDSFDLNNDGYLDIVISGTENTPIYDCDDCGTYETPIDGTVQVVWGTESGIFDYTQATHLTIPNTNPHGYNFVDMNNDGFYDIIMISVRGEWDEQVLGVYMNNGDGTFQTHVTYDSWPGEQDGVTGSIGMIYGFQTVDLDGDGDLDLKPSFSYEADWYERFQNTGGNFQGPNLFWENIGNSFIKRSDFIK